MTKPVDKTRIAMERDRMNKGKGNMGGWEDINLSAPLIVRN
jgi:hypothetical protein